MGAGARAVKRFFVLTPGRVCLTMPDMDSIGSRIAHARGTRAKAEIARAVGVDIGTVYRWEHGTAKPGSEHIAPLADTLGVGVRWLLTGEAEPQPLATDAK